MVEGKRKNPVAIILRNPEVEKQVGMLKDAAEVGVRITGKGLVVFYERSTRIGEIVKELFFVLTGISILAAGILATPADLFTFWKIIAELENGLISRIIISIAGLGLVTFGVTKLWTTLRLTEVLEKKEKFRQKKLV